MSALIEKFRFAGDSALEGDGFRTFGPAVKEGFPRPATRASARDPTGRRRKRHDHVEGRKWRISRVDGSAPGGASFRPPRADRCRRQRTPGNP